MKLLYFFITISSIYASAIDTNDYFSALLSEVSNALEEIHPKMVEAFNDDNTTIVHDQRFKGAKDKFLQTSGNSQYRKNSVKVV